MLCYFNRRLALSMLASYLLITAPLFSKILMKPYLQAVTRNSITVMVESDSKAPVVVHYSISDKMENEAKTTLIDETDNRPTSYVHKIIIKGLEPNQSYNYYASQGNKSDKKVFRTAVLPGTSFRFAVAGDFRSNPGIHSQIANHIRKKKPYFSLYTGDLCFGIKYSFWKDEFFTDAEQNLDAEVPFFNSIGNHEGWEQNTKAFTHSPESASGKQEYYSFDYGDMHVLVLSSVHKCSPGSPQFKFAEEDLKNTTKIWKCVLFHHPAYAVGSHSPNKIMRTVSDLLLEKYKVDFVFAGHNHFYQHNLVKGIHHLVLGGGGAPLYTPDKADYTLKSLKSYNYGIFDVTPNSISMKVYNEKGEEIDSLNLKK